MHKVENQIPDKVLVKLNRLFLSWGVKPQDWALATEPALQRQGYAIYDDKNPFEIDLWVKAKSLPWLAKPGWMTIPSRNSRYLKDLEKFVKNSGYSLHMVPSPFAGFLPDRLDDAVDYKLPKGKSIRLLTPAIYIEQLTKLVTHPVTRAAFWVRLPKLARRASLMLDQAREKNDTAVARDCELFIKLATKLIRQKQPAVQNKKGKGIENGVVKGQGVGRKIVRGKARLILHARDFGKMKKGEILIAYDTNPEYLLILRKIKAIITDNGGISCHASIIAREFNIPAVVGTRFATQVFKTGDRVEVDAVKGIVRKL